MRNPRSPSFGVMVNLGPDPTGLILHTGYYRFTTRWNGVSMGIGGLAKWTEQLDPESRLDVLAIHADSPGRGEFRTFIKRAKQQFRTICVWITLNPSIAPVLVRYGFKPEMELQGDGETVDGWRWDRTDEPKSDFE